MSATRFTVDYWEHAGARATGDEPGPHFFILKIAGPRGIWPIRAVVLPPDQDYTDACVTSEQELDLEFRDDTFIEVDCPVEDPVPGEYRMRLFIDGGHVGDFPFRVL